MEPAYTAGAAGQYDRALRTQGVVKKVGRHLEWSEPYLGGWVWRTAFEARQFIERRGFTSFAVYLLWLPTGWAEDVARFPDSDGVHCLRNAARIVRKVWP